MASPKPTVIKSPTTGRSYRVSYDVSLENFDADDDQAELPGTPRSVEALNRMGVAPDEIVFKRLNDFKKPGKHPDYAKLEWEAYDRLRRDTVEKLLDTRMVIVQEQMADNRGDDLAQREAEARRKKQEMIDKEKRRMEFVQERQQKQLEQKMQFEMMQAKMEAQALGKLAQQQAKAEAQELERKRKQAEYERDRERRDAERKEKEEQEELRKEREQHLKAEKIAQKEEQRAAVAAEKKARANAEIAAKKEKQARKIKMAKEMQARQLQETQEKMAEKFALTEVRRRAFQDERERLQQEAAAAAEAKRQEIEEVKIKMQQVEVRRKEELLRRQKASQDRLRQKNEIQARLDKEKRQADIEKERQRREVRVKAEADFAAQIVQMQERQHEAEIAIEDTKRMKKLDMDKKVRGNMLKRQLKMDKVDRSKRAIEYKRELAMQKIEEDAARQRQIKAFKEAVAEERKEMQRQALLQQMEMDRKVEAIKKKMAKESAKAAKAVLEAAKEEQEEGGEPAASAPASPAARQMKSQVVDCTPSQEAPKTGTSPAVPGEKPRSAKVSRGKSPAMRTEAMGKEHRALMAEDQVQAMWRGQNEKLLRLLEEEEIREAERDQAIKAVQYEMMERQRLERQFDTERQEARERIMNMTQTHERLLLARMTELGLIGNDGSGQRMVLA